MRNLFLGGCVVFIVGGVFTAMTSDPNSRNRQIEQMNQIVHQREAEETAALVESGVAPSTEQPAAPLSAEEEAFYGGTTNSDMYKRISGKKTETISGTYNIKTTASEHDKPASAENNAPAAPKESELSQKVRMYILMTRLNYEHALDMAQPRIWAVFGSVSILAGLLLMVGAIKCAKCVCGSLFYICNAFLWAFSIAALGVHLTSGVNIFTFTPKIIFMVPLVFLVLSAGLYRWADKEFSVLGKLTRALSVPALCAVMVFGWSILPGISKGAV